VSGTWRNHGETDDPAAGRPVSLDYEEYKVVFVIMAGTRGNFYEQLKRYLK
jgi:hypothetical protein